MANQEHVNVVRRGSIAISQWRLDHPGVRFDLNSADLANVELGRVELIEADLSHADLTKAVLTGADLTKVDLTHAKLGGALINRADLSVADLSCADLTKADFGHSYLFSTKLDGAVLNRAFLIGTNFYEASLIATDFTNAFFMECNLSRVDLSKAVGLETAVHMSASSVGIDTLMRSRESPPTAFLKSCGVTEEIIDYLPSIVTSPFAFYSCFISYNSKDERFARHLHDRLQQENLTVWFAPKDMRSGRKLYEQIDAAIRVHDKLLLVLSRESMGSEWVKTEIRRARIAEKEDGRQKLFPIRLCDMADLREWQCFDADLGKDLAVEVREYHIPNFSRWKNEASFEAEFLKLLQDLRMDDAPERAK